MKKFSDILEQLAQRYSRQIVFSDFLQIIVCALSMGTQEELYFETIKRYEKKDLYLLQEAFALLVAEMDNEGEGLKDCLGDYFMEYISGGHNGQYFTPSPICEMLTRITLDADSIINQKTVNDCACGSGRMFLAAAKVNRFLFFSGADISRDCCLMALINLCLNNLEGEIIWMDSLAYKIFDRWIILKNVLGICTIAKSKFLGNEYQQIKTTDERKPKTDSTQLLLDFVA